MFALSRAYNRGKRRERMSWGKRLKNEGVTEYWIHRKETIWVDEEIKQIKE